MTGNKPCRVSLPRNTGGAGKNKQKKQRKFHVSKEAVCTNMLRFILLQSRCSHTKNDNNRVFTCCTTRKVTRPIIVFFRADSRLSLASLALGCPPTACRLIPSERAAGNMTTKLRGRVRVPGVNCGDLGRSKAKENAKLVSRRAKCLGTNFVESIQVAGPRTSFSQS